MSGTDYTPTAAELAVYEKRGYLDPVAHPLLVPSFVDLLVERFRALEPTTAMPTRPDVYRQRLDSGLRWWRGMHLEIPELWQVARHPILLDRARALLGPNIMWGGAWMMATMPGEIHGWHFDSEYQDVDPGIVVFVGLRVNEKAPLAMITRSQYIDEQPSVWLTEGKRGMLDGGKLADDDLVLEAARRKMPDAELVRPAMQSGDFVVTHGRMWHGVRNDSPVPRLGMIFFLARPSTHFRIIAEGDAVPVYHPRPISCAMLAGEPVGAINTIVAPPAGA